MYTLNKKNQIQQNYVLIQLKKLSVWENSGEEGGDFFLAFQQVQRSSLLMQSRSTNNIKEHLDLD